MYIKLIRNICNDHTLRMTINSFIEIITMSENQKSSNTRMAIHLFTPPPPHTIHAKFDYHNVDASSALLGEDNYSTYI